MNFIDLTILQVEMLWVGWHLLQFQDLRQIISELAQTKSTCFQFFSCLLASQSDLSPSGVQILLVLSDCIHPDVHKDLLKRVSLRAEKVDLDCWELQFGGLSRPPVLSVPFRAGRREQLHCRTKLVLSSRTCWYCHHGRQPGLRPRHSNQDGFAVVQGRPAPAR